VPGLARTALCCPLWWVEGAAVAEREVVRRSPAALRRGCRAHGRPWHAAGAPRGPCPAADRRNAAPALPHPDQRLCLAKAASCTCRLAKTYQKQLGTEHVSHGWRPARSRVTCLSTAQVLHAISARVDESVCDSALASWCTRVQGSPRLSPRCCALARRARPGLALCRGSAHLVSRPPRHRCPSPHPRCVHLERLPPPLPAAYRKLSSSCTGARCDINRVFSHASDLRVLRSYI